MEQNKVTKSPDIGNMKPNLSIPEPEPKYLTRD